MDEEEEQAWHAYLAQHPEVEAAYAEQVNMAQLLQDMPEVEPPPHLTGKILRAVKNRRSGYISFWQKRSGLWQPGWFLRPAYGFAAGLALGLLILVAVLQLSPGNMIPGSDLVSGTIGSSPGQPHHERIELDQIRGQLLWISQPHRIEVQLRLTPTHPVTVAFTELQGNMTLTSFRGVRLREIKELRLTPETLTFQLVSPCNLTLDFSSADETTSPFQFQIYQSGQLSYHKIIP